MVEESMVENSLKAQGSRLDKNGRDNIVVPLYSKYTDNGVYFQIKLNIQFTFIKENVWVGLGLWAI